MRSGFSLIEVIIVLLIAGVLGGLAAPQISKYTSKRAVHNASTALVHTAAQARAQAIQTGQEVEMRVRPTSNSVVIVSAGDTVGRLDLASGPVRATLVGTAAGTATPSTAEFVVCYVPRGYARPSCGDDKLPRTITFASPSARDTARAVITVGQVERQ
jgi:prepilin-type N-terminal cleavage/methylation domain-containing protein